MTEHTLTNNQLLAGKTKQPDSSEALIQKTPGVCGGRARIRKTRIPVWTLVSFRSLGASDRELLVKITAGLFSVKKTSTISSTRRL